MTEQAEASRSGMSNDRGAVNIKRRGWVRRLLAFLGPAYLISVGYMDPGNWATDIEGGRPLRLHAALGLRHYSPGHLSTARAATPRRAQD